VTRRVTLIVASVSALLFGVALGVGGFTFVYARGSSYLGDDPEACGNCHVMREHVAAWRASSHHTVAVCNDCHAPAAGLRKYWVKAVNGFHHSYAFTTGDFPEPFRITPRNRAVTEERCRSCHATTVAAMGPAGAVSCIRCHDAVGHRTAD
jgi:cytochrome c nitrite reductase small subunit